ncbi:MAG TPA: histidinol-phosphate transaminase [Terriglobales bacterium]|nr:histidinol-phosphate transaminase [Terriglobales bacterium]
MLRPRELIAKLKPYRSPILSRAGLSLDLNESMAGCSPRVLARLRSATAGDVSLYPEREVGERLVADFLGVAPEQVLLTNGMDEGLSLVFSSYLESTYLGRNDELLFADPTFVMYPVLGDGLGARVVRVQAGEELALPVADLLARISPRTRVIAIANPNNPTGLAARREDLLRIVEAAPEAAVVIDEAYFEFCGETLIPELTRHSNLFVGRTFSKAYGLAGLRLGVLIGEAEQISFLRRFGLPFNVNSLVLACLEEALADQAFVREHVAQVKQGRARLEDLFRELGLRFWPSQTNFVLARVGAGLKAFLEAMQRRGVIVRDSSANPGCEGCARITVGTPAQMDGVLQAIREAMAETRL